MCLFTNPSEICNHPECYRFNLNYSSFSLNNPSLIGNMNLLLQQQSIALSDLVQKSQLLNTKLNTLQGSLKLSQKSLISNPDSLPFNETTLNWSMTDQNFNYSLKLTNDLPDIIHKERGFSIDLCICDQSGFQILPQTNLSFGIELYTVENPPKLLKVNISGKKILRGTVEAVAESGKVSFSNVVVNEVTSHYPNNKFFFVVSCSNSNEIKPLVISGVTVRARKHKQSDN